MKYDQGARHHAKKSLGQNFLTDPNYIRKIVAAVGAEPGDSVIEIGPGLGALTEALIESGAEITAIELDRDLARLLCERFASSANFRLVEKDALEVDFSSLIPGRSKLVANLPYYISTAILQRLAEQREAFSVLVLMFQKEVVDRITARPGDSDRGFLTVIVESAFQIEKLFDIPRNAFRPVPKVTSSVVRLVPKECSVTDEDAFRALVSTAFMQKRKTILNNLKVRHPNAAELLERSGIDPRRRAESLTLDEWLRLSGSILAA